MNKLITKYIMIGAALLAFACDKDDLTGDNPLSPSSPTVNIAIANSTVALVEKDSTFEYTITLSEPQISDVDIYVTQIDGDASEGDDFTIGTSLVRIPANSTTGKAVISVKNDDLSEDTETFTIQIGDDRTANASITPQTVKFTIMNVTETDLPIHLSWDVDYFDATGAAVAPDAVADMILYITDENGVVLPDGPDAGSTPDGIIDGASYEDYIFRETLPDGTYLIKAGIYDAINPGQLGERPEIDLLLDFSQVGKIGGTTFEFKAAFGTAYICNENLFTLASIVKTGSNYVVTEVGEQAPIPDVIEGTYTATLDPTMAADWFGLAGGAVKTVTVTKVSEDTYQISDVSAGAYDACCGYSPNQPVVIVVNPCLGVRIVSETGTEVTGQGLQLGSFDAGTNTFTVHFQDSFDSAADGYDLFTTFVKD